MMQEWSVDCVEAYNNFNELLKENKPTKVDLPVVEVAGERFVISSEYHSYLEEKLDVKDNIQDVIYGKDKTEGIVSIDVRDDIVYMYMNDGTVKEKPMTYWFLTSKASKDSKPLNGNQHYKYITTFNNKSEYLIEKKRLYKYGIDSYSIYDDKESALIYNGMSTMKGLKVSDISVLSFDIESTGLSKDNNSKVLLITNTFRNSSGKIEKKHFRVDKYTNDHDMIEDWCSWVVEKDPSVLVAHNGFSYDIPYLQYCYGSTLPLGKYGDKISISHSESKFRVDGGNAWKYNKIDIPGRHIIDTMFLAVKYDIGRKYRSWGLKSIIEDEGLVKKGRQFYDASKIKNNWEDIIEREKIVEYGIDDSDDALALYDLMIPSIFYMTQSVPKSFQTMGISASGSQLNSILVRAYLQDGGSIPKASEVNYIAGGMSYGIPGLYKNVVKFDAKSYYPSTINTFSIYDEVKDPKGYFLNMVKYFTDIRFEQKDMFKKTKDKHYDDLQLSSKTFINSSYGILGTRGLNFNSPKNAQLITKCCRAGLQKATVWATGRTIDDWWSEYKESQTSTQDFSNFDYIDDKAKVNFKDMTVNNYKFVNCDTDAIGFCKQDMSPFSDVELDEIQTSLNEIMYSEWEDDGKFKDVVILKAKNYILKDYNDKVTYKGSSIRDQKKPKALTEMMKLMFDDLMDTKGANILNIYNKYIRESYNIQDMTRWSTKKSVTEAVLNPERTNEQKILDALQGLDIREGDKYHLYSAIDGETQDKAKGELLFYKDGKPKMIPNDILKLSDKWSGDENKIHYVKRVYKTIEILKNVINMETIPKYHLKSNIKLLEEL